MTKTPITLKVVNKKRFAWSLVAAALFLLVISVMASWVYYQKLLRAREEFYKPAVGNQSYQNIQNATNNFTIGR
jgi:hypothetical protein